MKARLKGSLALPFYEGCAGRVAGHGGRVARATHDRGAKILDGVLKERKVKDIVL
jgi:hypothetical protein